MATFISVNVYDFSSTGNAYVKKNLITIPTAGAIVYPAASPDPRVFCYSRISFPHLGIADPNFLTAETVAQLLTRMNA